MLEIDFNKSFFVYPPTESLAISWESLVAALSRTDFRSLLDPDARIYFDSDPLLRTMPQLQIYNGSFGGGIVASDMTGMKPPGLLWLLMTSQGLFTEIIPGMNNSTFTKYPAVSLIKNQPGSISVSKALRVTPRLKPVVTAEHCKNIENKIFYVILSKRTLPLSDVMKDCAEIIDCFGLTTFNENASANFMGLLEASAISSLNGYSMEIVSDNCSAKFHVSVLAYIGWLLCKKYRGIVSLHVIAEVESAVNFSDEWKTARLVLHR